MVTAVMATDITIAIIDYGVGIPIGEEDKIFDYRQRGSNAIYFNQRGQGLGLYVCRKIISRYGGKVYLKNHNNPTVFVIELPRKLFDSNWHEKERSV